MVLSEFTNSCSFRSLLERSCRLRGTQPLQKPQAVMEGPGDCGSIPLPFSGSTVDLLPRQESLDSP